MGQNTLSAHDCQEQRLKIKSINQQMKNLAVKGTGLSPWEAEVLVDTIEEVYFNDPNLTHLKNGQIRYSCIDISEPPGKPVSDCQMRTVVLTVYESTDNENLNLKNIDAAIEKRQRRIMRISEEAMDQKGLLSQEDLAEILMCDVRTIRRDISSFKKLGIIIPTRGTIKDIGPGVTHREIAVRLWIEGKEPTEICTHIKHSIKSVENYIEKFKRVSYMKIKGFTHFEIARTAGLSDNAVTVFSELFDKYKAVGLFKYRMDEIQISGSEFYNAHDEKKEYPMLKQCTNEKQRP